MKVGFPLKASFGLVCGLLAGAGVFPCQAGNLILDSRLERAKLRAAVFPFAFSSGPSADSVADVSFLNAAPAGADGFVRVEKGRLATAAGELRLSGANLTGSGNFPSKPDAVRLADKLMRFGINAVRLHYMDPIGNYANFMLTGAPCLCAPGTNDLDFAFIPEQLDKLEFLVSEFKQRGIYVDLNLHVGRFHGRLGHRKGETLYNPDLIASQKEYARRLLDHVNPYTGLAWKEEPAVLLVEIANEDSIFCPFGYEIDFVKDADAAFKRFLMETERRYYAEMKRFLRDEIGVKSLVTGSQLCASPFEVQEMFEVTIDNRYWCHPEKAGCPEWTIVDAPLADYANGEWDPLAMMAKEKTPERAFLVTEYGHPYPASYGCETLPLLGAAAAVGGWSGIFPYSFSHRAAPTPSYVPFFFTIGERADLLVHQPAVSVLVRDGHPVPATAFVRCPDGIRKGHALLTTPQVKFFSGWGAGRRFDLGDGFELSFAGLTNAFATVSVLRRGSRLLVAASASCRNTGARYPVVRETPEGYPVLTGKGSVWGAAPILYSGVAAELRVPLAAGRLVCLTLDGAGRPVGTVPVAADGAVRLDPAYKTLWYEVTERKEQ